VVLLTTGPKMLRSDRARRLAVPLAAFGVGLGVLALALALTFAVPTRTGSPGVGGAFVLVDQDGRTITEKDFVGRPYLVFFGFTHCPDVCPTTLYNVSEVLRATGNTGRGLRALFVTVDPERDTPAVLKSYLASFDPRIAGATGDSASVEAAVKAFRAFARKVPTRDGDYTMEHTSSVYLMDSQNRFLRTFNPNRPPEEAARDLLQEL
jgi:protein SCO1/2